MSVEINGAEQFAVLARRLKELGDKELSREFSRSISTATRPLIRGIRQSARDTLPRAGGLADRVAKTPIRTQRSSSSKRAGVRIVGRDPYNIAKLDKGRLRHPVFADPSKPRNQWTWVNQKVKPGWWTTPTELAGKSVQVQVEKAMAAMKRKLDGRL